MAEFDVLKASEAPRPSSLPTRLAARMREYEDYVMSLKKGQVGKLVPGSNESARSVALRVSRAGKRSGRVLDTWVVDGTVYFKPS